MNPTLSLNSENLILLGDSISKGIVLNEENGKYEKSSVSFAEILKREGNLHLLNLSRFGATVRKGMEQVERQKDALPADGLLVLEFGGNDCNFNWAEVSEDPEKEHSSAVPLPEFVSFYEQLIEKVKLIGLRPVLLNLPPLNPCAFFSHLSKGLRQENILRFLGGSVERIYRWQEMYSNTIPGLAQKCGCLYLDIRQRFLNEKHYEEYICGDGIHPNEKGQELIADTLLSCFRTFSGRGTLLAGYC